MSSPDPNKAMFSFKAPNFNGTLRGPFCVKCMNKKQASDPKVFYSINKDEGGLPIYMHTIDGKIVFKINELVYQNGSCTPFTFQAMSKVISLLLLPCESRTCSFSKLSLGCDSAAQQLVYVNKKGIGITVERIQKKHGHLLSLIASSLSDNEESSEEMAQKKEAEERLRQKECELDDLLQKLIMNECEVDLENHRYGRSFFYCVRDIEKEFERTPCPLTPQELVDFRIDIASMVRRNKKIASMVTGLKRSDMPFFIGYDKEDCSDIITLEKVEHEILFWRRCSQKLTCHINAVAAKEIQEESSLYCEWCEKSMPTIGSLFSHCISRKHLETVYSLGKVFSYSKDYSRALKLFEMASSQAASKDRLQITN